MDKLKFVDTHIHHWDLNNPDIHYGALQPDYIHPVIGPRFSELRKSNYFAEDFIRETRNSNVIKAVHVEAASGTANPVNESKWLQELANKTGFPHAIVAHANLKDPDVESTLAQHCEYPNVRGIRDYSDGNYLLDDSFHRGFSLLEKYDLVASLEVRWPDMYKLRDMLNKFPNITMVLDHAGFPLERTEEYFMNWQKGMRILSEADNAICKISGLGMCDFNWTIDTIRPWVLDCIEAFGTDRCVFATNWPVDKLFSTYDDVIDAYTKIISEFSIDEKIAMFSGNAERIYRI